jgi:hypothetical protein
MDVGGHVVFTPGRLGPLTLRNRVITTRATSKRPGRRVG